MVGSISKIETSTQDWCLASTHTYVHVSAYTHALYVPNTCVHTLEYTEDIRMIYRNLSYQLIRSISAHLSCGNKIQRGFWNMQNHEEVIHLENDVSVVSKLSPVVRYPLELHNQSITLSSL